MSDFGHAETGDKARRDAQYSAAVAGGMRGALTGAAISGPTIYLLHRNVAGFRGLSLPVKTLFGVMAVSASGVWSADRAGLRWDREHYSDRAAQLGRQYASRDERDWAELSSGDKALTWAKDNKFGVVAGSWLASMGGIFAYIHSQPMSFSQKLVQTRVWAQGFTLASLLAMAAITQIPTEGDKILRRREEAGEHSWRDFIGDVDNDPSAKKAAANSGSQKSNGGSDSSSSQKNNSTDDDKEARIERAQEARRKNSQSSRDFRPAPPVKAEVTDKGGKPQL